MSQSPTLAVIGAGKLGETLIQGLLDGGWSSDRIVVRAARSTRVADLVERLGVRGADDNASAAQEADIVVLAVKPPKIAEIAAELAPVLTERHLLISVAACVSTAMIEEPLTALVPVVRAMPNTPCLLRQGITGIASGCHATEAHITQTRDLFAALGRVVVVEEKHMDAVTGLSASGPAFIYIIIESLAEAGVKVGLPRDIATELAAQTVLGSAAMVVETGEHPARLKEAVTTPAGCTMDGILELEDGGLRVTLIKAVVKATERAQQLVDG